MRFIKIAGLALASMLVMSMAIAGSAAAVPLWLLCLPGPTGQAPTKYTDQSCTKAAVNLAGSWQSESLCECSSDTVKIRAYSLRLSDTGTLGGTTTVKCNGTGSVGWGLITGRNLGLIKVAEVEKPNKNCELVEGGAGLCTTAKLEEVKGANLPWKVHLFETENKVLTDISGTIAGKEPGWTLRCGGLEDTCTTPEGKPELAELSNLVQGAPGTSELSLLVRARFEEKSPGNCTLGGNGTGHVSGLVAILLWKGLGLSINRE